MIRSILAALRLSAAPNAAFVTIGLFWGCWAAYVPAIKAGLGVGDGTFGLLLMGSACGLVSAMWIAPRVDRALGRRAMPTLAVLFVLAGLLPSLMGAPAAFLVSLFVVGLCSGLLDVSMNARVSELEAVHGRPLMNGSHAMFAVGYAISALVAGIEREAGLPPVAAQAVVAAAVILLLVPRMALEPRHVEAPQSGRGRYPWGPILLCGSVVLSAFMTEAAVESWSALHIERTLGGRAAEGALGPFMLGLTLAIGRFSGQAVAERLREVTVVVIAGTVASLGALIAAWAPSPGVAYLGFGLFGLGVSVIGPMGLALVGKMVAPHFRTEAISRAAVMGFSGFFFAPVIMGLVSQSFGPELGLRAAFTLVAGLVAASVPLALVLGRRSPVVAPAAA
jgi:MFS family permease